jgi:hypothetical protein
MIYRTLGSTGEKVSAIGVGGWHPFKTSSIFDGTAENPQWLMKWGFILVTLYMGPIGLLLYVLADKEPKPGTHEEFTSALWKQGVGSTIHCLRGWQPVQDCL